MAVPYGVTVDFDSLKAPHSVTLRERDSTTQIRCNHHHQTSHSHNYHKITLTPVTGSVWPRWRRW